MLIALVLANSLFDEPPLLRARFDIAAVQTAVPAPIAPEGSRYRMAEPTLRSDPPGKGVEVKLRWKRVRVRMPIPSL